MILRVTKKTKVQHPSVSREGIVEIYPGDYNVCTDELRIIAGAIIKAGNGHYIKDE